uniref:Uncharacterized protein n=1 Tax=Cacopsylla melanoneura TaxID=428564 RepID=A0A8D8XIZ7_9HEMI
MGLVGVALDEEGEDVTLDEEGIMWGVFSTRVILDTVEVDEVGALFGTRVILDAVELEEVEALIGGAPLGLEIGVNLDGDEADIWDTLAEVILEGLQSLEA